MRISSLQKEFVPRRKMYLNYVRWALANKLPPGGLKNWLIRRMGVDMGKNVFISPWVYIDPMFPEYIHIGENVFLGWNARLFSHIVTPYSPKSFSRFLDMKEDGRIEVLKVVNYGPVKHILAAGHIWLEDGVFVGGFTTVRAGVRVGEGATIGSDSLVTKDVQGGALVVGKPAKEVVTRGDDNDTR